MTSPSPTDSLDLLMELAPELGLFKHMSRLFLDAMDLTVSTGLDALVTPITGDPAADYQAFAERRGVLVKTWTDYFRESVAAVRDYNQDGAGISSFAGPTAMVPAGGPAAAIEIPSIASGASGTGSVTVTLPTGTGTPLTPVHATVVLSYGAHTLEATLDPATVAAGSATLNVTTAVVDGQPDGWYQGAYQYRNPVGAIVVSGRISAKVT